MYGSKDYFHISISAVQCSLKTNQENEAEIEKNIFANMYKVYSKGQLASNPSGLQRVSSITKKKVTWSTIRVN